MPHLLLVLLLSLINACGLPSEEVPVIKFTHVTAPNTPKGQAAELFKELAEKRLPGRIKVEVFPSSQLMNNGDALEAIAFGEVQMIAPALSNYDRFTDVYQVFDLPFLFSDIAAVERFQQSRIGQSLLNTLTDRGMTGLAYWHNGMKQFGAQRALHRPEQAEGLKFRIMEADVLEAQILQLGGSPQKMAFAEVYQALQTGAVDAQENTWSNIYSQKFYEVQDYVTETNHGYLGYMVAVNTEFWVGLPDEVRAELEQIMQEVTNWVNQESAAINLDARAQVAESGKTEIVELSEDELIVWRERMRPVWRQFEDDIGTRIIAAAQGDIGNPHTVSLPEGPGTLR